MLAPAQHHEGPIVGGSTGGGSAIGPSGSSGATSRTIGVGVGADGACEEGAGCAAGLGPDDDDDEGGGALELPHEASAASTRAIAILTRARYHALRAGA
ncbi:hypothetical protein DB32_003265 [Sandaracinus amylolyticus]|uniref:Uncharacterized protein n=1 Tax=Sandaracinus amylolyticus TaxID=927083 RepID=A0A0F6YHX2_9BACT|nr:hypothetical protein DB32_003265 [Sandaracinus amylolyticus]